MTLLRRWAGAAGLAAVLLYLPSLANGFAYDDRHIVVEHEALHDLSNLPELWTRPYWPDGQGATFGLWRPVTTTVLALSWWVGGGEPWTFHLVNVLLHGGAAVLVVLLLARLLPVTAAGLAGMAFALHPVHVEAVANGVGLAEVLSTVGLLLALLVAGRPGVGAAVAEGAALAEGAGGRRETAGAVRILAVVLLYLAASLSKEGAYLFPALLVIWDGVAGELRIRDLGRYLTRRGPLLVALTAAGAALLVLRHGVLGSVAQPNPPLGAELLPEIPRMPTVGGIWFHVLRLVLYPAMLSPDYTPPVIPVTTVWTPRGVLGVVGVLAILAGAGWLWRIRDRLPRSARPVALAAAFGVPWFAVAFLPVTNLVFVAGLMLGERTLYLPSVGGAAVAGALGAWALARSRPTTVPGPGWIRLGLVLVGALWAVRTVTYIPVWKDDASVFGSMMATVPESGRSRATRGDLLLGADRVEEATREYARAMATLGDEYAFLTNTARRYLEKGRTDLAGILARRAAEEEPGRFEAFQILTMGAARDGDWPGTVRWSRAALERAPRDRMALHLGSTAHTELGEYQEARELRERFIAVRGGAWQDWYWLAGLRAATGDSTEARAAVDSARALAPGPEQRTVIDSLGRELGGGSP